MNIDAGDGVTYVFFYSSFVKSSDLRFYGMI